MSRNRKSVRAKIHGELKNMNLDIDPRASQYKSEKNRYDKQIEQKKLEKRLREQRKQAKFHIGNRKNLRKTWELEV